MAFLVQSFWRDEAFSYILAKRNIFDIIILTAKDFNPPLYYLLLHFWMKLFGWSEISLRSFSLIFFWATVYVCMHFIEDILKIKGKKSWIYLILIILNPLLNYYAFEARMYTLFTFFATLSFYSFFRKKNHLYLLSTILGLYTHYFMIFVLASQAVYIWYISKKYNIPHKSLKKMILTPLYVFAPWLLFVLIQKHFFSSSFWLAKSNIKTLIDLPALLYTGYEPGGVSKIAAGIITLISLFFWGILFAGIKLMKKHKKMHEEAHLLFKFLFIWSIIIPTAIVFISFIKPIFFPRYIIFATPGLLLLLFFVLEFFRRRTQKILILIMFLITIGYGINQVKYRKKDNFRKTMHEIKALAKKDDVVYVESTLDYFTASYYFDENRIYISNTSYDSIPDYVGKVLIPKEKIAASLPFYPKKAYILKSNGSYLIQALY